MTSEEKKSTNTVCLSQWLSMVTGQPGNIRDRSSVAPWELGVSCWEGASRGHWCSEARVSSTFVLCEVMMIAHHEIHRLKFGLCLFFHP